MELKKLVVNVKEVWVDFPGLSGFKVKVANLSRKELLGLRKRCTVQKFDRKTRQLNEELDDEKFVVEFTGAVVKGWEGLTLAHLETLLLIDTEGKNMEEELPYSLENAEVLVSSSTEFDTWLNEVVFDLENFRGGAKKPSPRKTGKTVSQQ